MCFVFSCFDLALSVSGMEKLSQRLIVIVRLFLLTPQAILMSNTLLIFCTEVVTEGEMISHCLAQNPVAMHT